MKHLICAGAAIFLAALIFCAGWLITVHTLIIECDHPAKMIYITDWTGNEWAYNYSFQDY